MHEQTKRQVAASGVAGDGDLREAAPDQTNVAGPNVIGRSWKRMFRCKPVVWDERSHSSPSCGDDSAGDGDGSAGGEAEEGGFDFDRERGGRLHCGGCSASVG